MNDVKTAAQQWQRVKTILADALECPSPEDRATCLERSCGGDTTLMREVEALLAQSTRNLEELAVNTPMAFARHAPAQPPGRRIGAYEIVREIGRGGMGAVYLAKRADGQFEKEVAIKLLKRGTDTDEILRRFQAERRILARLDHPNITRLLDAGTTDDGLPYFVMEYVVGERITDFVRERKLSVPDRLRLFLKICGAVECAHKNHVVHRDLKPGNISVTRDGEPKLLDFGIAKLLEVGDDGAEVTLTSERRMTPICASPEQARGEAVTAASDVYALGALLYELLTEQTPHRFLSSHPSSSEIFRVVCEQEPLRPSLAGPKPETRPLRGDLDNIVLMALRKEPARRYPTVAEFAEDIQRHLDGRPVRARPSTAGYLTTRFVARHKQPIGALFVAALVALFFVLFYHPRAPSSQQSANALPPPDKSIAVLPFENLSDDKANSFFADGMQDEILTDLAKVADLKVISRTSVMQYKNVTSRNLREIARQLGVAHVLEGSVQRVANRIRVSAQLIDARTDAHLWAEHYERNASDVFAIQNEIAKSIAEQLQVRISPNERRALEEKPTTDLVAYDLYLRAKELAHGISTSADWEGDNRRAVDLLDRAVIQDPDFALAYCLLADLNLNLYRWTESTPARLTRARTALDQAVRIAPELGETYLLRAEFLGQDGKWERALEMLALASKALPGSAEVLEEIASVEEPLGHWNEAVRNMEKAKELDPRGPNIPNTLTGMYRGLRDYAKSDQIADAAIAAFPKGPGYFLTAKAENALDRGDTKAARAALASIAPGWDPSGWPSELRVRVAVAERNYAEASHLLATIRKENLIERIAIRLTFLESLVARQQGDLAKARSVLLPIRQAAESQLREQPDDNLMSSWDDTSRLSRLARIDAYLGRNEDALREARKAVELKPISRDAVSGPGRATIQAEAYMWAGERDKAIELLSQLAKIPYGPSYGDLLGPRWDALRDDPRFAKVLEGSARPIDLMSREDKKAAEPAIPEKSIAVLPFENLSDDKANSFFADGVQDEILTDLAKLKELKVISRTSVMQYKDATTRNLREIGRELGVAHVLEGSVQRAGNRIRISAQLIDARTDSHLWAENYERDLADVFAIQNEIAKSIAEQLQAKISPNEKAAIEQKPTNNLVAYDLYLRAKALLDEISVSTDWEGDNRRAVDLLDRAVTQDRDFALAHSLLYDWNLNLYDWVDRTPARLARAEAALKQLIRIAPEAGETYLARSTEYKRAGDLERASEMLEQASKTLPSNTHILILLAQIERRRGNWSETVRNWEKARELDPKSPNIPNGLCDLYAALRDYKKADQVADAAIAAFPNGPGYFQAAKVHNALDRGDVKAARTALAALAPGWDPSGITSMMQVEVAVADRNYAEVAHFSVTRKKENVIAEIGVDISFMEALVARKQGDRAREESILLPLRESAEADLHNRPEDSSLLSRLALIDAYLGRKEDALREGEKAVELKPISRDAVSGPGRVAALAEVCMVIGNRDRAIQLLSEVAKVPYGPSYGDLLRLRWDTLRNDPRFQRIVEELASTAKL